MLLFFSFCFLNLTENLKYINLCCNAHYDTMYLLFSNYSLKTKLNYRNPLNFFCVLIWFNTLLRLNISYTFTPNLFTASWAANENINSLDANSIGLLAKDFLTASRTTHTPNGIVYSDVIKRSAIIVD